MMWAFAAQRLLAQSFLAYCTTKVPVMIVGWTSHRKKYVPGVVGAVNVYVVLVGPVTMLPTNIDVAALELVYTAKLCGTAASMLLKFTVTFAPAGTVIVPILNARFCATKSMVTADDEVVVGGTVVVGGVVVVGGFVVVGGAVVVVGGVVVATVVLGGVVVAVVVDGFDEHPHAAAPTISSVATARNAADILGNCLSRCFISYLLAFVLLANSVASGKRQSIR